MSANHSTTLAVAEPQIASRALRNVGWHVKVRPTTENLLPQGSFIPRRQTNPHNKEVHGTAEYTRSASQFSIVLVLDCQPFRMWISVIPEGRDLGSAVLGIVICPQFALQRLTRKVDKRQQTMHAFKSASVRCKSKAPAARESSGKYVQCGSCPEGYVCDMDLCCPKREYLCTLPYDAGKFGSEGPMSPRFFYNPKLNNCMFFTYFGNKGNANNFLTYNDCTAFCKNN
uniref:BPTI/Kunitz inhibitor domain-containing protein n=1 Tax=Ascaris lumbricoides TaxID=6252 RepID=A0A0M3HU90_ASCLU